MNYADARPLIKTGDLIAFTHKKINSWYDLKIQIVRAFTRSEYSHVAVAYNAGTRLCVMEAVMPVSRIWPLSLLGDFYWVPLDTNWTQPVDDYAWDHLGVKYSQLVAMLAPFEQLNKTNFTECAAWVANTLQYAGINLGRSAVPSAVVQAALELGKNLTFVKGKPE